MSQRWAADPLNAAVSNFLEKREAYEATLTEASKALKEIPASFRRRPHVALGLTRQAGKDALAFAYSHEQIENYFDRMEAAAKASGALCDTTILRQIAHARFNEDDAWLASMRRVTGAAEHIDQVAAAHRDRDEAFARVCRTAPETPEGSFVLASFVRGGMNSGVPSEALAPAMRTLADSLSKLVFGQCPANWH